MELRAEALLLLTDVAAVFENYGGPEQRAIGPTRAEKLYGLDLAAGFTGPRVAAASEARTSGKLAGMGRLTDARAILEGRVGTRVLRDTAKSIIGEADRFDRDMWDRTRRIRSVGHRHRT